MLEDVLSFVNDIFRGYEGNYHQVINAKFRRHYYVLLLYSKRIKRIVCREKGYIEVIRSALSSRNEFDDCIISVCTI